MDIFYSIFPDGFQDSTIRTSVLIGLLIVWFFQETFGWNFTGLVVPGYLASVLVMEPVVGVVILAEALLTWLVATAVMDWLPHSAPISRPFGRDRFFLLLAASIGVRLLVEGAFLEWVSPGLSYETARTLHSVGLVVVPLTANALWRTGLVIGLPRLLITTGLCWAILKYGLLPYTNLSLEGFRLAFEDPALSFLHSPRSYLILMIGAMAGSIANERYGWEFGGIIVPGLLAFLWLDPIRLGVTLLEAVIIAGLFLLTIRLPGISKVNLTGGRPLVLAYCLGYAWKFGLVSLEVPMPVVLRDPFGFGYLLSAILALRIVKTKRPIVVLLPTLLTSAAGFGMATVLEVGLQTLFPASVEVEAESLMVSATHQDLLLSPPPAARFAIDIPGLIDSGEPRIIPIEGLGTLSVQPCTQRLALSSTEGEPLMLAATVAIAEELGACAVLICSDPGLTCTRARNDIRLRYPLLELHADTAARLFVPQGAPPLDLQMLSGLSPSLSIEPGAAELRLQLDLPARIKAAEMFGAIDPAPLGYARTEIFPSFAPLPGSNRIRELLATPLLLWEQGDDRPLRVAAHTAHQIGAVLQIGSDAVGRDTLVIAAPDWEMILRRQTASTQTASTQTASTQTASTRISHGPLVFGLSLATTPDIPPFTRIFADRVGARALLIDFPVVWDDPARALQRPTITLALALLASTPDSARPEVYSLFGTPDPIHDGADIQFGDRLLDYPGSLADSPMVERIGLAGILLNSMTVRGLDGDPQRPSDVQSSDLLRPALLAAGADVLSVHIGERLRRFFQPLMPTHPAWLTLTRAGIVPRTVDPSWPVVSLPGVSGPMSDLLRMGRRGDLETLRAAGLQGIGCDPGTGCHWLIFEREGGTVRVPLLLGMF